MAYAEIEASERALSATLAAMTQQVAMLLGVAVPVAILRVAGAVTGAETGAETGLAELRLCLVVMGIVCALAALWFLRLAPDTGGDVSGHGPDRSVRPAG